MDPQYSRNRRGRAVVRALAACVALSPAILVDVGAAHAQGKQECMTAYEQAQELRHRGELLKSRQRMLVCAQPTCHTVISRDCTKWVTEVEELIPSVLVSARTSAGKDIGEHELFVDGQPLDPSAGTSPILLDPGRHTIRYTAAGFVPYEDTIVMSVGDRNRMVRIVLRAVNEPPAASSSSPGGAPDARLSASTEGGSLALPLVLAGVSVAALGASAYFYFTGVADARDMQRSTADGGCKPNCPESDVDAARTKILIGNVGFGVGLVAAGAAVWTYLASRPSTPPARGSTSTPARQSTAVGERVGFGAAPVAGGGVIGVWSSF